MAQAEHAGIRDRIQLHRRAALAAERERPLRSAYETLARPERARTARQLASAEQRQAELTDQSIAHHRFRVDHPEAVRRLDRLDHEITALEGEIGLEREALDGVPVANAEPPWFPRPPERTVDHRLELGL